MSGTSFSLLDEPWVPCQLRGGETVELSLRDVFARAREVRRLSGELPITEFALLRLLLAILYGAIPDFRSADDWARLRRQGLPIGEIHGYLEGFRSRFDLLHPETPFFQVAGLRTERGEVSGLEKLIADVPNGRPFFTTRLGSGLDSIGFAEAARWLITAQAFDPSGIKSGAVGDPRVKGGKVYPLSRGWAGYLGGTFVEGRDLHETLLLNLVGSDASSDGWEDDAPSWHRPAPGPDEEVGIVPTGPALLYTWPSRRIRLDHDGSAVTGVLIAYGDALTPQNQHTREPMTRWRRSPNQEKKLGLSTVYMPRELEAGRALWRGIASFIPEAPSARTGGESSLPPLLTTWLALLRIEGILGAEPVRLHAVGVVYGTNDSVIDEIVADTLLVDVLVLASTDGRLKRLLNDAQQLADEAAGALAELAGNIAAAGGLPESPSRGAARAQAFAAFDPRYRKWLEGLGVESDVEAEADAWRSTVRHVVADLGDEIVAGASPAAWRGREVRGREVNAPLADVWFRAKLNKITRRSEELEETR